MSVSLPCSSPTPPQALAREQFPTRPAFVLEEERQGLWVREMDRAWDELASSEGALGRKQEGGTFKDAQGQSWGRASRMLGWALFLPELVRLPAHPPLEQRQHLSPSSPTISAAQRRP